MAKRPFKSDSAASYQRLRRQIREAAGTFRSQLEDELQRTFTGRKMTLISEIPEKNRGGEWDWWTDGKISKAEKARLRRNWMTRGGTTPDNLLPFDSAMNQKVAAENWLELTRKIDILRRFENTGKLPSNMAAYGGIDLNDVLEPLLADFKTDYRIDRLSPTRLLINSSEQDALKYFRELLEESAESYGQPSGGIKSRIASELDIPASSVSEDYLQDNFSRVKRTDEAGNVYDAYVSKGQKNISTTANRQRLMENIQRAKSVVQGDAVIPENSLPVYHPVSGELLGYSNPVKQGAFVADKGKREILVVDEGGNVIDLNKLIEPDKKRTKKSGSKTGPTGKTKKIGNKIFEEHKVINKQTGESESVFRLQGVADSAESAASKVAPEIKTYKENPVVGKVMGKKAALAAFDERLTEQLADENFLPSLEKSLEDSRFFDQFKTPEYGEDIKITRKEYVKDPITKVVSKVDQEKLIGKKITGFIDEAKRTPEEQAEILANVARRQSEAAAKRSAAAATAASDVTESVARSVATNPKSIKMLALGLAIGGFGAGYMNNRRKKNR